jgi:hypothetical protein
MTVDVLKKPVADRLVSTLFDFYIKSKLQSDSPYDKYQEIAEEFIDAYPDIDYKTLDSVSFLNPELYNDFDSLWSDEFSKLIFGLDSFIQVTKNVHNKQKPFIIAYTKPKRQVSPSQRAYLAVGNNKLDIKHSKASYARLFDPYI